MVHIAYLESNFILNIKNISECLKSFIKTSLFKVKKALSRSHHYFGGKTISQLKIHELSVLYLLHITDL